jgi:hypothetical protein
VPANNVMNARREEDTRNESVDMAPPSREVRDVRVRTLPRSEQEQSVAKEASQRQIQPGQQRRSEHVIRLA